MNESRQKPTPALEAAREKLRALLGRTVRTGTITLSSGRTTDFYIDGRLVTLDPEGLFLVSSLLFAELRGRCDAVGGPTSAADPIVAGIGLVAREQGVPLRLFFTRKQAKEHGMQRAIEGPPLLAGDRVFLVDDVATTGGSLVGAARVVREQTPAQVVGACVIVDREEGAVEALAGDGIPMISLFRRRDLIR